MDWLKILVEWVLFLVAIAITITTVALVLGYIDGKRMEHAAVLKKQAWRDGVYRRNAEWCDAHQHLKFCRVSS